MVSYKRRYLQTLAENAARRSTDPTRHKCFISYHEDDDDEVKDFIDSFGDTFIARVIGVSADDLFIDSDDPEYIKRRIRELYLTDSTVTIVLIGKCTWARRFVDWEIASSLRNDPKNRRSGLLGITLPSVADDTARTSPARLNDNLPDEPEDGYARWRKYPKTKSSLRSRIEDAFGARDSRADIVDNTRSLFKYNRSC